MNVKQMLKNSISWKTIDKMKYIYHLPTSIRVTLDYNSFINKYNDKKCTLQLKDKVLSYVESMRVEGPRYRFSEDTQTPTLYASAYACMIRGAYDDISEQEKREWSEYFDSCQREQDGLFTDNIVNDELFVITRQGFNARQLLGHMTAAYDFLGTIPQYEFSCFEEYKSPDNVVKWLAGLNYNRIWGSSNEIMNAGIAMQYARDRMNSPYEAGIDAMEEYLCKNIRKEYGLWYDGNIDSKTALYEAIRGAYHIIPILYYDRIEIPYAANCLKQLYSSQNRWGGFDNLIGSGACEDIDAIDPLLRLSIQLNKESSEIDDMMMLAKRWVMFNQNTDGGFAFNRKTPFQWGDYESLHSSRQHSNMFATWFRTLAMQLMEDYQANSNLYRINTPGMECPLFLAEK